MSLTNVSSSCYELVKSDLISNKYTDVLYSPEATYYAPDNFVVVSHSDRNILTYVDFQHGPIKECGVNGVANEDLIAMVICRLEHFQLSPFACKENAEAIKKLEESLMWLRKRTFNRENRGVEGASTI